MIARKDESKDLTNSLGGRRMTRLRRLLTNAARLLMFSLLAAVARGQSVDPSFADLHISLVGPGSATTVGAIAVQPDGKILIGGVFSVVSGATRNHFARLNPDGTLDTAFNPNPNSPVNCIAIQADGKILVGGYFTSIGGQTRRYLARLDGTTGLADSFNPNADLEVVAITLQSDGKILAAGHFHSIGGQMRNSIARLEATTGLADSFDAHSNSGVDSIVVQPDSKILVGGSFANIGGEVRHDVARLDPITGAADSFAPNPEDVVVTPIVLQPDGKVLVAGRFSTIGGQLRNSIARVDGTTGLADSFNPNAGSSGYHIYTLALQADGKVLAGGTFNTLGGQPRYTIGRVEPVNGLADSFNPSPDGLVSAIAIQPDGKILVGGMFSSIAGQSRRCFTRLNNNIAALQELVVTADQITWMCSGSVPQFTRVTFESSLDGVNYAALGQGASAGSNWTLAGLNLPIGQNISIRARGFYPGGSNSGSQSIAESVQQAFLATPGTLGNISTRVRVLSGDNALIGGMIATGSAGKRVIIRAIGPSLIPFGIPGALTNPTLDLFQGSTLLLSNDDWNNSTQLAEIANSGLAPSNSLESAIIWTLMPGQNYTAVVRGLNGTTGVGIVEAYDLDQAAASKLGNISTRGFVDVDDNVMIAGLIAGPSSGASLKVLVRALGPTLSDLGVAGALANPTLDLVNSSGTVIRSNNNWKDDPLQRAQIEAAGLAPSHDEEAALVETVAPGAYTAIVRGINRTTGVGLVEAYNIP